MFIFFYEEKLYQFWWGRLDDFRNYIFIIQNQILFFSILVLLVLFLIFFFEIMVCVFCGLVIIIDVNYVFYFYNYSDV